MIVVIFGFLFTYFIIESIPLFSERSLPTIDIWHFVVQASLELNLTPDDIVEEYKKKNEINRERQKNGY